MNKIFATGFRWLWLSVVVFVIDYMTKVWVLTHLELHETQSFIPFLQLTYVRNFGVAFGQLTQQNAWILAGFALAIAVYLAVWLYQTSASKRLESIALCLIIGGALGNLYDRIVYGYVVDFFDFYVGSWHWYVFNVADAAISIGVVLLLVDCLLDRKPIAS